MKLGIVGKPNVGKSSIFKALTLTEVEIADYPFTTIEPNVGIGYVKVKCACLDFGVKCNPQHGFCIKGNRFVPVEIIDVAGLVPGAHKGKGLGNKFLDDLRQADILIHVVDASGLTNEKGERISRSHDPRRDVEFLEQELVMWVFEILKRNWNKTLRKDEPEKILYEILSGLKVKFTAVKNILASMEIDKKLSSWSEEEIKELAKRILRECKPIIIAANKVDIAPEENIEILKKSFPEKMVIPCSAHVEIALKLAAKKGFIKYIPGEGDFEIVKTLSQEQEKALRFIKERVLDKYGSTGVQSIIDKAVFDVMKYNAVFPVGEKLSDAKGNVLPDCYLMPFGSTALDLAYRIHKDFGDNFIRAIDMRTKKIVGKDYVLKHRDVIQIISKL